MKLNQWMIVACLVLVSLPSPTGAQTLASNFVLTDRATRETVSLTDFAGQVVVLDFFAYWCGPCKASAPIMERDIVQYYEERSGNQHGIPVHVIPVNVQQGADAATDDYVQTYGLSHAADDWDGSTWGGAFWGQFGQGGIPHFVIINGATDSTLYQQWEVLHSGAGFPGAAFLRSLIDTIDGTPAVQVVEPSSIQSARRNSAGDIIVSIPESRTNERYFLEWDDGRGLWQPVDPLGLLGNGENQILVHSLEDPAPAFRLYRVRSVAE